MTNGEALRAIMASKLDGEGKPLTRRAVANLLGVAVVTVDSWLARPESGAYRNMPASKLRLLELELLAMHKHRLRPR